MKLFWPSVFGIVVFSLLASAVLYSQLPPLMSTHWNAANQANGNMPKEWAVLIMPAMMLFLAFLLYFLPKIDPLKHNLDAFRTQYQNFILVLLAFLAIIHLQILLWNAGFIILPSLVVSVGLAFIFFYAGKLCEASKPNYFIEI